MIVIGWGMMMSEKVEITMMNGFGDEYNNDSITSRASEHSCSLKEKPGCSQQWWITPLFSVDDEGLKVQPQDTGQAAHCKEELKVTWGRKISSLSLFVEQWSTTKAPFIHTKNTHPLIKTIQKTHSLSEKVTCETKNIKQASQCNIPSSGTRYYWAYGVNVCTERCLCKISLCWQAVKLWNGHLPTGLTAKISFSPNLCLARD